LRCDRIVANVKEESYGHRQSHYIIRRQLRSEGEMTQTSKWNFKVEYTVQIQKLKTSQSSAPTS